MSLNETIFRGMKYGVNRHWRYTKDLLKVKPEYLLTVTVADEIANCGINDISGLELLIKLEEPTYKIAAHLWMGGVGYKRYFKERISWKGRRGKVDIFIQHEMNNNCHIVELKNFDPSVPELRKELKRFIDMFQINTEVNPLKSCHLAFPSKTNINGRLEKYTKQFQSTSLKLSVDSHREDTGENPEDGMPVYFCNIISITRENE